MTHTRLLCAVIVLPLLTAVWLPAQTVNATLVGTITDSSGAVVPNAKVVIQEPATGISRSAETNTSGNYSFANVPPGAYTVTVELAGFRKAVRSGVDVIVNTTVRVDLTLQPGNVSETVEVTAAVPMLQTDRSDTGRKVEEHTMENLPVSTPGSRNFQVLLNLVPGTTRAFRPHSEFFNPQNSLSTQVNGQSRLANNLQFEGVDNNERTGLLQVLIPPIEALETIDISTSNFDAELGRATGAVTNIIMKSGTNSFHGQGYWYNRVSALSARAFYDPVRSHFVYNYFGGQFGGPIIKNRMFFFGDFLEQTDHRYAVDRYTLPTADERAGNLGVSTSIIYDPATGNPDGSGRQPFANQLIPASRIQAIPNKILGLVPLPNLPGLNQNYYSLIPFTRTTPQFDVKVDHNQTDDDRISVRYSYSNPKTTDGAAFGLAGGPHGGGFQGTGTQETHNGAINYNHIFSPTLITEFRAGVSRYRNDAQQFDYGAKSSDTLGVPGVNTSDFTSGIVGIDVQNFSSPLVGYSASLPWIRSETNIDLVNTWTKTLRNHTIKWGVDLRRVRDDLLQTQTFSPRGRYQYGNATTTIPGAATSFGNNLAGFLLDLPTSVGRDLPIVFPAYRAWQFYSFVQDNWVVTPKLTVNLGLRWEFYPPALPAHDGGFSNYNPAANSLVIAGVGGNPSNLGMKVNKKDFAPRLGVAYRFTDKTVFRAGFGISYSPFPDNTYAYNFPVKQNNAFNQACSFCPAVLADGGTATLARGFPVPTPAVIPSSGVITNADLNQTYDVIHTGFREPYVASWNVAVQRALPRHFALEVGYVANHGVAQPAVFNLNASTTIGADNAGRPLYQAFKRTADTNLRYVGYSSSYNSMQVKLDRRFSNGFSMTTAITYGKALGYQSEDGGITFYINGSRNWQRLNFDRKFNFTQSYVYELPFGKGKHWATSGASAAILGGWQVNGVLSILSGSPLNFGGNASGLRAPGNGNTLDHFGPIQTPKGNGRNAPWFDPTKCSATVTSNCFAQPQPLQFGNLGLDVISGPGSWNLDASVFRSFKITERFTFQVRGESFSVMNTPNWNNPDTGFGNATFGYITGASGNRSFQIGGKLLF
ncbi:MAG: TonB-dependent receptor [Bryobacterales bacterium]|nr:TonB-dependent receptor [Bryobacterales bacterium]